MSKPRPDAPEQGETAVTALEKMQRCREAADPRSEDLSHELIAACWS